MCAGISAALLSSSFATGTTSRSAKSRTLSRIWTCSSVSAPPLGFGIGITRRRSAAAVHRSPWELWQAWSAASVDGALLHQDATLIHADFLPALIGAGRAHVDDTAIRFRSALSLVEHFAHGDERVARMHETREPQVPIAQVRQRLLGKVLDRHPEDDVHDEQRVGGNRRVAEA